jgi:hypothetical protein
MVLRKNSFLDKATVILSANKRNTIIAFIALFFVCFWVVGHFVYSNPNRVFSDMVSSNLDVSSFTKQIVAGSSTSLTNQIISVQLGAKNRTISEEVQTMPTQKVGKIVTLNVGTPNADYSTFLAISTTQTGKNGKTLDYSPIVGIWGYSKPTDPSSTTGQLFTSSIIGSAFAIGNVNNVQKEQLLNYINSNKIYSITGAIKRQMVGGRLVYVYPVTIKLQPLAILLVNFGKDLGLNLPNQDTKQLAGVKEPVTVTVDVLSRQLRSVVYGGSSAEESYSSFGAKMQINLPKNTIPLADLEKKLETISNS